MAFRRFLEHDQEHSFVCYEAASAAEGIARCRELRPHAVLLDYRLPDEEGLAVLASLIDEHGPDAFAMLLLTGQGSEQLAVAAMKLGAHDYLVKDLHLRHQFGRAVAGAIERARLRRALAASTTHLQQIEKALRIERDRFLTIVETVPGVVHAFRLGPDGAISFPYASPRITEIYGLPPETLADDAAIITSFWHPDDAARLSETFEASRQQLAPWHEEFRVRHPTRGQLWVEGHSIPQREPDGSTIWYGVLADITERKHAEQALARSSQRLQILAEASRIFDETGDGIDGLLKRIVHTVARNLRAACTIHLLSDDGQGLDVAAFDHYDPAQLPAMLKSIGSWRISLSDGVPAAVAVRSGQSQFLARIEPAALRATPPARQQGPRELFVPHTLIVTPLQLGRRVIGTLMLARGDHEEPAFTSDDLAFARDLAERAALALDNTRLLGQVQAELAERTRAEAETREREHKLSTVLDMLPIGISILDEQRRILYANPALKRIAGLSDSSVHRQTYMQRRYFNAAGQPMMPDEFASARASREHQPVHNVETGIVKEDGSQIWINVSAVPVDFPDWKVVVATDDVTERKQAAQALGRSNQRLRVLAEASHSFTQAGTNEQQVLALVAQHTAETLQSSCTIRMLSQDAQWLDVVALGHYDPALLEAMQALIQPERMPIADPRPAGVATRSGQPQLIPVVDPAALIAITPASQQPLLDIMFPHTILSLPLRIRGRTIGCLTFARSAPEQPPFSEDDLTLAQDLADRASLAVGNAQLFAQVRQELAERQRAEAALEAERQLLARRVEERTADLSIANAELARAARLKDEFLANMSHELRTPLNSILGRSEALQEAIYGAITPEQDKALQGIETSGRHLLALINDILDLSKIEANKLDLYIEPVALERICHGALQLVTQLARQKRISLTSTLDSRAESLLADERRLKQILVNLLSNAVKFTPEGGSVGLDVQSNAERGAITFTVWDTGIGITEDDHQRLFRPFVQVDSRLNRQYEGTGLGLALVLRLAEAHGGSVAFESAPGQGSRFSVTLPWNAHAPAAPPEPEIGLATHAGAPIQRALLIEDSPSAVEQLERYLNEMGVHVEVHTQANGAVERATALQPDIIVLDILLPDEVGWEILRQLKNHPSTQSIPVLIVSVIDEPEQARALGAAGFLCKPIDRARFTELIQRVASTALVSPIQLAFLVAPEHDKAPARSHSILLAEDNQATITMMQDYLRAHGYDVVVARNGGETLLRAQEATPALILMDIQMPGMDGLEAIRHIRAHTDLRGIPIIALTALAMPGDRERCLAAGADDYLTKPVNLRALLAAIQLRVQQLPGDG